MTEQGKRRPPKKLSAETKWEIFLQVTAGEITQADAARKWQVVVSTVIGIRRTVKDAALAALARAPGRPLKERNWELEAAHAEIGALTGVVACLADLVGEEPVAELGVVAVGVEDGVGQLRLVPLGVGDRLGEPAVVGLAGDAKDPARHRDGDPVVGELSDERVDHFPGRFACDRYAAARRSTSFSCSSSRMRFFAARSSAFSAAVVPGLMPSSTSAVASQLMRHDSEIPKSAATSLSRTPGSRLRATGSRRRGTPGDRA